MELIQGKGMRCWGSGGKERPGMHCEVSPNRSRDGCVGERRVEEQLEKPRSWPELHLNRWRNSACCVFSA